MQNQLIRGDALNPSDNDLIAQVAYVALHDKPRGDGWRLIGGGAHGNEWARIATRYEAAEDIAATMDINKDPTT